MLQIATQEDFDQIVMATPNNEKILIYPKEDGTSYKLEHPWYLPFDICVEGVGAPVIEYIGFQNYDAEVGLLHVEDSNLDAGSFAVTIRNLVLKGNNSSLYGISCKYVGLTASHAAYSEFNSDVVGNDVNNLRGVTIEDCIISGFFYGISLEGSYNNIITGNTIDDSYDTGIRMQDSEESIITNNIIQNSRNYYGIQLYGSSSNVVTGNTIQNSMSSGIFVTGSVVATIINGNTIQNNGSRGIHLREVYSGIISGNAIQNNSNHGIYVDNGYYLTISGNTTYNNGEDGINLEGLFSSTITGNTIQNNGGNGIYTDSSTDNTITGNTVHNNNNTGIYLQASSRRNAVYSNVVVAPAGKTTHSVTDGTYNLLETTHNKLITLT